MAAEEKELGTKKPLLKGNDKKAAQRTAQIEQFESESRLHVEEFSASGLDAAMELMDLATADKSSTKESDKLDRHPERRVKSAYAAFEERELPRIKQENPGLRLSQIKQMLQKTWKKSPENPMNQAHISFDTTRSEEKEMILSRQESALNSFKTK